MMARSKMGPVKVLRSIVPLKVRPGALVKAKDARSTL